VQAGQVKLNNLGVGAEQPGEVTAEDDIYMSSTRRE
jgi:splicing factor 4